MPELEFTLNGQRVSADGQPAKALDLIREGLGLTGTKLTCGVGGCGACVVSVNGVPTETCTLDSASLAGAVVTTVEGIASDDGDLVPVQRAMIAHDAVQCGFCSPGVVVTANEFVSSWRQERGNTKPDRADVEDALGGHLCRCGAYPGIVAAVQAACSGEFDDPDVVLRGRPDAAEKLTGSARYTVDVKLEGMLEGAIVRSELPRAMVDGVESEAALAMPGVVAAVDLLGKDREVRYVGQPIAAVAALDKEALTRAIDAIEVMSRPLPHAIGMKAARSADAPNLIGRRLFLTSSYEAGLVAASVPRRGNVRGPMSLLSKRRFTARKLINKARSTRDPLLVDDVWTASSQAHAAAEPHSAVASWDGDALTVHLSTQSVRSTSHKLAKTLGLDRGKVKVIAEHVGGAFGAKQGMPEPVEAASRLAMATGAPVRMVFDAAEELAYGGYRPGAEVELAVLGGTDGMLKAVDSVGYMDAGDSAGQTVVGLMRISYPGPPMDLHDHDVISNGAPAKPFQAPGAPIALFALEGAVDELAERLDTDPLTLRRGWGPRKSRRALYDWVESHDIWQSRDEPGQDGGLRGVGVAFGSWYYGYDPATEVRVHNDHSGLIVETGVQDMGTGARTTLARAVASVFGVETSEVRVRIGDSSLGHGPTSSASRTTTSVFPAARHAATDLRDKLVEVLATNPGMAGAVAAEGGVSHAGEFIPWSELWSRLDPQAVTSRRPKDSRTGITPVAIEGVKVGWGVSDAAHIVEVEVDAQTGSVRVKRAAVALAAGTIHTKDQAVSQVHGALARGIGEALLEERITDTETGEVTTASYDKYRILRMSEMPEVDVQFIEEGFEHAAGGGAGIAELAITSVPAAVANAVAAATGWRPRHIPMTPDRVMEALAAD